MTKVLVQQFKTNLNFEDTRLTIRNNLACLITQNKSMSLNIFVNTLSSFNIPQLLVTIIHKGTISSPTCIPSNVHSIVIQLHPPKLLSNHILSKYLDGHLANDRHCSVTKIGACQWKINHSVNLDHCTIGLPA